MKYKDFEDYLQTKHAEQYLGLDDEMPDDYNDWLDNLSIDDWIDYGNKYGLAIMDYCIKVAEKPLKEKI
jgi:hypothetical protein